MVSLLAAILDNPTTKQLLQPYVAKMAATTIKVDAPEIESLRNDCSKLVIDSWLADLGAVVEAPRVAKPRSRRKPAVAV